MKRLSVYLILLSICFIFPFSIYAKNKYSVNKNFVDHAKHLLGHLARTEFRSQSYDYWPNGGIQNAYFHFTTYISFKDMVRYSPVKVFRSGPHQDASLDLLSRFEFGHYNPAFLNWMKVQLTAILADSKLIKSTRRDFDTYLAKTALTYWDTYKALEKWPAERDRLLDDYKKKIADKSLPVAYYYNIAWRGEREYESLKYLFKKHNVNVVSPAVYFWLRRRLDSTHTQFRDMLQSLLKVYGKL